VGDIETKLSKTAPNGTLDFSDSKPTVFSKSLNEKSKVGINTLDLTPDNPPPHQPKHSESPHKNVF